MCPLFHRSRLLEVHPQYAAMQQLGVEMAWRMRNTSSHGAAQQRLYQLPERYTLENFTMLTAEQLVAAHKANIETLFGLTSKAFEGVEKLVELNLQVAKAALGEVAQTTQAALNAKDAQELLALQAGLLQPAAEKAAAYSRHVYDIAAATNADLGKAAEAQASEAQKKFLSVVDNAVKNAP